MIRLHVNVDHIATIREARKISEPDPVIGAAIAELAGADGITVHLREDRRHTQERDVNILKETVQTRLNLEIAATEEMFELARKIQPEIVTIVPEKREEITTEGGLNVLEMKELLQVQIPLLQEKKIQVSLFIDPAWEQVDASHQVGSEAIELHTGAYANAKQSKNREKNLQRLYEVADYAHQHHLQVNAGHGLNYQNLPPICKIPHLCELNIGHSIISRSVFVGLTKAVQEMKLLIQSATNE